MQYTSLYPVMLFDLLHTWSADLTAHPLSQRDDNGQHTMSLARKLYASINPSILLKYFFPILLAKDPHKPRRKR